MLIHYRKFNIRNFSRSNYNDFSLLRPTNSCGFAVHHSNVHFLWKNCFCSRRDYLITRNVFLPGSKSQCRSGLLKSNVICQETASDRDLTESLREMLHQVHKERLHSADTQSICGAKPLWQLGIYLPVDTRKISNHHQPARSQNHILHPWQAAYEFPTSIPASAFHCRSVITSRWIYLEILSRSGIPTWGEGKTSRFV